MQRKKLIAKLKKNGNHSLIIKKQKPRSSRMAQKNTTANEAQSVESIQFQMSKLMKQLKDLDQFGKLSYTDNAVDILNLRVGDIDKDVNLNSKNEQLTEMDKNDCLMQLLLKDNFSDLKLYILDEADLKSEFPEATPERIKVERDLQAQHYVHQKFLEFVQDKRESIASGHIDHVDSEMIGIDQELKMAEDSFYQFICPLCLKLMQKCVTTLCGHSYCESCLDRYLLFKETCFVCDFWATKRVVLRDKPHHTSFKIDDVIG